MLSKPGSIMMGSCRKHGCVGHADIDTYINIDLRVRKLS
jgi:hypothetical protein